MPESPGDHNMDDLNSVLRALRRKENAEENLNRYADITESRIMNYALVNLALHAVSLAEACMEGFVRGEDLSPSADLLRELSLGNRPDTERIRLLRDENILRMKQLTDDVDIYSVNEYMLNRIEHRFNAPFSLEADYTDQKMTDDLLLFLSHQKDEAQNLYTVRFIEQLPVRMTKNRFLEILSERLTVYKDNDRASFDDIMTTLRSAALLKGAASESLKNLSDALSGTPVDQIDEKSYRTSFNLMTEISAELNEKIDLFQILEEVLNDLFAVALCFDRLDDVRVKEHCLFIIGDAAKVLLNEQDSVSEETFSACENLEGLPEETIFPFKEALGNREDLEDRFLFTMKNEDLDRRFEVLRVCELLLSNSLYAPLEKTADLEMTPAYYRSEVEEFLTSLMERFSGMNRQYQRAVMARVFSVLPPHFTAQEELETYIFDSLAGCRDTAEKLGVIEILQQIMEETA